MRILIIVSERPPVVSGVARSIARLTAGLEDRGHTVDIVASTDFKKFVYKEYRLSAMMPALARFAQNLPSYDVVNVHGAVPTVSDAALLLLRGLPALLRPPVIYTHHCNIDLPDWKMASQVYNRLHGWLVGFADGVVVTTPSYRDLVKVPRGATPQVIPWGVDLDKFTHGTPGGFDASRPLRILFVGQMRPYKGVGQLIDAVANQPLLELTIVGSGALEEGYRSQVQASGAENITFLGRVSDEDLVHLFGDNDVVTLPSLTTAEAFGLVLLEGMASACVPVATNLPGVNDLVGSNGILVEPGDVAALRKAFLSLAGDPLNVARLQRQAQQDSRTLGWSTSVDRYEETFREAVTEYRRRLEPSLPDHWREPDQRLSSIGAEFEATSASLLLFDASKRLNLRSAWGDVDPFALRHHPPLVARHVARTATPLLLSDRRPPVPVPRWPSRPEIASSMVIPLPTDFGTAAVLSLGRARDHSSPFTSNDLHRVGTYIRNAAAASG